MRGTIRSIREGYGFISPEDGSREAFFHRSALQDGRVAIDGTLLGRRVEFDLVEAERGPRAERVRLLTATD